MIRGIISYRDYCECVVRGCHYQRFLSLPSQRSEPCSYLLSYVGSIDRIELLWKLKKKYCKKIYGPFWQWILWSFRQQWTKTQWQQKLIEIKDRETWKMYTIINFYVSNIRNNRPVVSVVIMNYIQVYEVFLRFSINLAFLYLITRVSTGPSKP